MTRKTVPLSSVVKAAIGDTYSDIGATQHRYSHWAARGLYKLIQEKLRLPIKRSLLTVDRISMTASLPIDFDSEVFVGYIKNGIRVPIFTNRNLVNTDTLLDGSKCNICQQENMSEDFNTEMSTGITVEFNNSSFEETVTKKVFSDGSLWIFKHTPYLDVENEAISWIDTKEFVSKMEVSDVCGCIKNTELNKAIIKKNYPSIYNCYFTGKSCNCDASMGGYKIFEEAGLVQLESNFKPEHLYMEYNSFMPKINGEYHIPRIAFETLVNWTKFKAVENRPNIPLSERNWNYQMYKDEKSNMSKILGRAKLSNILNLATRLPKFDISK